MLNIFDSIVETTIVSTIRSGIFQISKSAYTFLKNIYYKLDKLDGYWIGEVEIEGILRQVPWSISRFSDLVCAFAIPDNGPNRDEIYYGVGSFKNSALNMSYMRISDNLSGTISLHFDKGTFRGFMSYLDCNTNEYKTTSYILKKRK